MSSAKKNNAREQRRRAARGDKPNSVKHAESSIDFIDRKVLNPTKNKRKKLQRG